MLRQGYAGQARARRLIVAGSGVTATLSNVLPARVSLAENRTPRKSNVERSVAIGTETLSVPPLALESCASHRDADDSVEEFN